MMPNTQDHTQEHTQDHTQDHTNVDGKGGKSRRDFMYSGWFSNDSLDTSLRLVIHNSKSRL